MIIALDHNGERIRPEQGYSLRLLVPGYPGNLNVQWLRRLEVSATPMHTKDETSKYSLLLRDGTARRFDFERGVKSLITQPSGGMNMPGAGLHEIAGLAWSGAGRIVKAEVSTDGGASWREAVLQGPVLPKALTRFRLPVGLERCAGAVAKPRHRRKGQCADDARGVERDLFAGQPLPQQHDPDLGGRCQRERQQCLAINGWRFPLLQ